MKNLNSYLDRLTSMRMRPEVLQHAVDILKAVPQIQTELENPATSRMKREDIIQEIFPTESRQFIYGLVEDGALGSLDEILKATGGKGVERAIDASASDPGRQLAIRATREWGKIAFVGEGGTCTFNPSPDIIHGQKTIYGSWVTSLWRMEELVERLVRWNIHPEDLITHEFPLEKAGEAYSLMASGKCGKVAVVFND